MMPKRKRARGIGGVFAQSCDCAASKREQERTKARENEANELRGTIAALDIEIHVLKIQALRLTNENKQLMNRNTELDSENEELTNRNDDLTNINKELELEPKKKEKLIQTLRANLTAVRNESTTN
jgi:predicted RNase H-like nuclease (RuvC/YqgF family)